MLVIYCSPNGIGDGQLTSPCSFLAAKQMVIDSAHDGDIVVRMFGGVYEFDATVTFTSADSGKNGHKVYWVAHDPANPPVISGGRAITGWELDTSARATGKNIWKAPVHVDAAKNFCVNDHQAKITSRFVQPQYTIPYIDGLHEFIFTINDASFPELSRPTDASLCVWTMVWSRSTAALTTYSRSGDVTTFRVDRGFSTNIAENVDGIDENVPLDAANRTAIENAFEFLSADTKGYGYIDTTDHVAYYVPLDGEDMTQATAHAGIREKALTLNGAVGVFFGGVQFAHTKWNPSAWFGGVGNPTVPLDGPLWAELFFELGYTADLMPPAVVECRYSEHIGFQNCRIKHGGGDGLAILEGSKHVDLRHSLVTEISSNGITVGTRLSTTPQTSDQVSFIAIADNIVTKTGYGYLGALSIFTTVMDHVTILRNEVSYAPYSGIGWGQGGPVCYTNNIEIAYNKIHHIFDHPTIADGGAIYGNSQTDAVAIHDNYLYDNFAISEYQFGNALYFDEDASGVTYYNNVIVESAAIAAIAPVGEHVWLGGNSAGVIAYNNYASNHMILNWPPWVGEVPTADEAIQLTGIDPANWPVAARNIALASGPSPLPEVSLFILPDSATTLTVPATSFTATDDVAVTGYLITESSTPPLVTDPGWSATAPTEFTFAGYGNRTAWAWVKDGDDNVSAGVSASTTITSSPYTIAFAQQPTIQYIVDDIVTLSYDTITLGAEQVQSIQTQVTTATQSFIGTLAQSQAKQTEAVVSLQSIAGYVATTQAKQSVTIAGTPQFNGVIAHNQPIQITQASTQQTITGSVTTVQPIASQTANGSSAAEPTLAFGQQPVFSNGIIYYGTEDLFAGFEGTIIQLTPVQQQIVEASLGFTGTVAESQKSAAQNALGSQVFTGALSGYQLIQEQAALALPEAVTQAQPTQQQAVISTLSFMGVVSQGQAVQLQRITRIAEALDLKISVRDPLTLKISVRDPLQLKITVN